MIQANNKSGLNRNSIKYIVIVAMTLDHIAWGFVDAAIPLLGQFMHFFGRLTGPTMACFIAEGYRYTHDVKKYSRRLALFALISWAPFVYFETGELPIRFSDGSVRFHPMQSVIFTLFLGLTAIRLWDSGNCSKQTKIAGIAGLCVISCIGDWAFMNVLACLFLHIYRDKPREKWTAFTIVYLIPNLSLMILMGFADNWYQLGVMLVPPMMIYLYNGEGGSKRPIHKWFFYLYYPAHLLALGIIRYI